MDEKELKKLTEEFRGVVDPLVEEMKSVEARLDALEQSGANPASDEVLRLTEKLTSIEEEIRLLQTSFAPQKKESDNVDLDTVLLGVAAKAHDGFARRLNEARAIDSGAIASAGRLNPEQADAFIDLLVDQSQIFQRVRVRRMNSPEALLEQILVANRKLRKATENTNPALADSVSFAKRSLSTVETVWAEDLTLTLLEDNIERRGLYNHIVRDIARAFSNDLADLAWRGDESLAATITDADSDGLDDTTGLTQADHDFLRINNGWLAISAAATTPVDVSSATKPSEVLKALRNAYPNKFKSLRPVFFVSPAFAEAWGEELATRNTALGDRVIENGGVLPYFGYRLYVDPYLEKDGNISEKALFTLPDNLVFGIQRAISFDAEWVPRRRAFEITITARNDFEIVTPEPVALGTGVPQF